MISTKPRPPPGELLGLIFAGYVPLASQGPYPPIVDPILVTFEQICNFCNPNLVTFYKYSCIYLINPLNTGHQKVN